MRKTPYQVMPPLSAPQSAALKASIRADGIQTPIDVDEAGHILDGHQRLAIATQLGMDCPRRIVRGLSAEQKRHYALTVNLMRRQLDTATWGMLFKQLLEARGVKRGSGSRNDKQPTCATIAQVAKEVGVSRRTAQYRLKQTEQTARPSRRQTPRPAARGQKKPTPLMTPDREGTEVDQMMHLRAPIAVPTSWRVELGRALRCALNDASIEEIVVHVANVLQVDIVAK
jgi:AraC-like DNA-binding protein